MMEKVNWTEIIRKKWKDRLVGNGKALDEKFYPGALEWLLTMIKEENGEKGRNLWRDLNPAEYSAILRQLLPESGILRWHIREFPARRPIRILRCSGRHIPG